MMKEIGYIKIGSQKIRTSSMSNLSFCGDVKAESSLATKHS